MKYFILPLVMTAISLSACGDKTSTPSTGVEEVSVATPSKNRMNLLVGRSLVVKRAVPAQMTASCDTQAKIRKYQPVCRKQIDKISQAAVFRVKSCEERGKAVICKGSVDTKIGSANVVASFVKEKAVWQGKIMTVVAGTWKSKE